MDRRDSRDAHTASTGYTVDAHPPREIALAVEQLGVAKARTDTVTLLALAVLAGAFISLGALLFTVAVTDARVGFGASRLLGGLSFSLGLILVVVAGAELFTGNNLVAMAWVSRLVGTRALLRNWLLSYAGNVIGCLGTVLFVMWTGVAALGDGAVGETALRIANAKAGLTASEAFMRGVLGNALVCMAVWLAMGGRSVVDKILAVIFPITAFVAMGFEHSIANWFFLPFGLALGGAGEIPLASIGRNLVMVSAGNIVGGSLLVAGVYWIAYLRGRRAPGR